MPRFPPPNAATQQQLGINVTAHLQDGGSKSVYACVLVGGANNGLGAVVAIEATIQAAEPEAVRRLVSRPLHPNVIRGITHVHAAGPPGILYTVSEQLQVELFDNVINGGVILEGPARAQFAECVTALRHMHRMGVAHRDIKLENILLADGGAWRLCDFGSCSERCEASSELCLPWLYLLPTACYLPPATYTYYLLPTTYYHRCGVISELSRQALLEEQAEVERQSTPMYRAPELADLYSGEVVGPQVAAMRTPCTHYAHAHATCTRHATCTCARHAHAHAHARAHATC